jgi:hypothetical protein
MRLARICGVFGSDNEPERATAARMADDLIRQDGLTWSDVIRPPALPARESSSTRQTMTWRDTCHEILASDCSDWEAQFCRGLLANWRGPLTERQAARLDQIFESRVACQRRRA